MLQWWRYCALSIQERIWECRRVCITSPDKGGGCGRNEKKPNCRHFPGQLNREVCTPVSGIYEPQLPPPP